MTDSPLQDALLNLIEACGSWNAFDGPAIARDLRVARHLWRTAMLVGPDQRVSVDRLTGDFMGITNDYSPHRGLPDTLYGFDRLQVTPVLGQEVALETLANSWGADSIEWIGLPQAQSAIEDSDETAYAQAGGNIRQVILELWWD